ncbi:hypothetical protein K469DRAFT_676094 [Zopfia rhizophila CBS 207.26]|uniref:Uncharacterized protein n=1 Tax=Zopfia rhizophila CBS 207.26 TaxID=1314779 RepID=A0A6A6DKA1_9PEZI|nr:hypothetical protein K469DRAFT_676094 [Zopfia rhizophila CBS 207.26]
MAQSAVSETAVVKDNGIRKPFLSSPSSDSPLSDFKLDLRASTTISTSSDSLLRGHKLQSTYHVYHKRESHRLISPTIDRSKERFWGPTTKESKEKRKARKEAESIKKDTSGKIPEDAKSAVDQEGGSFFLHTPYLAFHDPPRVLYVGNSKHCVPAVLIHSSFLWRTWKLQFGRSLATPGVLDPRGVVCWQHNGGDKQALKADDRKLKGYKVRTWRLWGETGKSYVHDVTANRKAGTGPDPDIIDQKMSPVSADEVVYLKWTSPFSRDTRRYHFQYAGIDFYWKGTGTVKESRTCGFCLRYNHLKLVARLPMYHEIKQESATQPEVCLGKYTCSIAARKSGKIELYEGAIWHLMAEYMPAALSDLNLDAQGEKEENGEGTQLAQVQSVKRTRLYHVIVSTAMCMMIGEKQKRETIRQILEAAVSEGAGGGGG